MGDHGAEGDHAREQLKTREFTFDHSFWSVRQVDTHFVSQEKVIFVFLSLMHTPYL